ncbi:hypothetical protein [Crocosphaera subtropica]|nr:hypothetical protein [Crocosphaera subtropica]
MYLDEQLEILINEAPQHGVPIAVMKKAVAPTLKVLASQLKHEKYYVLHGKNGSWLVTTLSNRNNPKEEKRVIYAFSTKKDAETFQGMMNPEIRIISIPVTHLLFELFAVKSIDSLIVQEFPGNKEQQVEISRTKLQTIIQEQLRRLQLTSPKTNNIPPNLA